MMYFTCFTYAVIIDEAGDYVPSQSSIHRVYMFYENTGFIKILDTDVSRSPLFIEFTCFTLNFATHKEIEEFLSRSPLFIEFTCFTWQKWPGIISSKKESQSSIHRVYMFYDGVEDQNQLEELGRSPLFIEFTCFTISHPPKRGGELTVSQSSIHRVYMFYRAQLDILRGVMYESQSSIHRVYMFYSQKSSLRRS